MALHADLLHGTFLSSIKKYAKLHAEIHIRHYVMGDTFCAEFHENSTNNSNADNRERSVRQSETENRKNGRAWSPQNGSSSIS